MARSLTNKQGAEMTDFNKYLKKKCDECKGPLGEDFAFALMGGFKKIICRKCKGKELRVDPLFVSEEEMEDYKKEMQKPGKVEFIPETKTPYDFTTVKDVEKLIKQLKDELIQRDPVGFVEQEAERNRVKKKQDIFLEGARILKEISEDCDGKPIGQKFKYLSLNFEKIASECF